KFGARLEPLTHVSLLLFRGRNLDTVTQAEIITPFRGIRGDFIRIAAAEAMVEAVDKVAEEHERNLRLALLLLSGLRALEAGPSDPAAVAESFMLKLLSLSGFHPALTACAICGGIDPPPFSADQAGAVCARCAERGACPVSQTALRYLAALASTDLSEAGAVEGPDPRIRREARSLVYGFAEYHLERRMKSVPM